VTFIFLLAISVHVLSAFLRLVSRSQWPLGLRHELSSPAQTLGSWVPIPREAWMSVRVYYICAVLCAGSGLATG
jgi:hypothetical protein